MAPGQCLSPFP